MAITVDERALAIVGELLDQPRCLVCDPGPFRSHAEKCPLVVYGFVTRYGRRTPLAPPRGYSEHWTKRDLEG
jgi:hypothetical protein